MTQRVCENCAFPDEELALVRRVYVTPETWGRNLREGWEYPEILSDVGVPVACIRLAADGKILDTNFRERSNNAELDDSVERALAALKKKRGQEPVPVPTHLLKWTTKWTCFRLKPSAAR